MESLETFNRSTKGTILNISPPNFEDELSRLGGQQQSEFSKLVVGLMQMILTRHA
jgi:hypothetical protein